jgi:hypothetical protein
MNVHQRKEDLFAKWEEGRRKGAEGIFIFALIAVLVVVVGLAILGATDLDGLGISLMVIGLLIFGLGIAAKA